MNTLRSDTRQPAGATANHCRGEDEDLDYALVDRHVAERAAAWPRDQDHAAVALPPPLHFDCVLSKQAEIAEMFAGLFALSRHTR